MEENLISQQMPGQIELRDQIGLNNKVKIIVILKYPDPNPTYFKRMQKLGVETWPIISNAAPFLDLFFKSVTNTLRTSP